MTQYSLTVLNSSGASQNIAMYQSYPNVLTGLPLVWYNKVIPTGNSTTFTWAIDWSLNWGTSTQPLVPGVAWTSGGPVQAMQPVGGVNAMGVTYSGSEFQTSPLAYVDAAVPAGDMAVFTDTSFTVAQAELMSLAVYMNGTPTFAVQGEPNGTFLFETTPTYYICTTSASQGVAISELFVSSPTTVEFDAGVIALSYTLNSELEFVLSA